MNYLALPFVLREGYLNRANLLESITYSVGLIISSRPGALPFEPDFGCDVWDKEFSDLYTANKSDLRSSLRNAIDHYEKRLYDVSVTLIDITRTGHEALGMAVKVSGNFRDGSEEKKFEASYNIG